MLALLGELACCQISEEMWLYLKNGQLMHFLPGACWDHVFQRPELLVHLGPSSPLN